MYVTLMGSVGRVIGRRRVNRHFRRWIDAWDHFHYRRDEASIAADAALDDLHSVRTSLPESGTDGGDTVRACRRPGTAGRAFRILKTIA